MDEQQKAPDAATPEQPNAKEVFERFMAPIGNLKELDLTDIEPLLPPTYKESRYK